MLASRNEFQMKPARTAHLQWPCCHRAVAPCIDCRRIASQVVEDVPANIPRALLPEYITELILSRSPQIGKIRNLRIL